MTIIFARRYSDVEKQIYVLTKAMYYKDNIPEIRRSHDITRSG